MFITVLVYVLDSTDKAGLENVIKDIQSVLKERDLYYTPVMIVASKQDIDGMSRENLSSRFPTRSDTNQLHRQWLEAGKFRFRK